MPTEAKPFITGYVIHNQGAKKDILTEDLGTIYGTVEEAIENAENDLGIGDGDAFYLVKIEMSKPEKYKLSYTAVKVTTSAEKDEDREEE